MTSKDIDSVYRAYCRYRSEALSVNNLAVRGAESLLNQGM